MTMHSEWCRDPECRPKVGEPVVMQWSSGKDEEATVEIVEDKGIHARGHMSRVLYYFAIEEEDQRLGWRREKAEDKPSDRGVTWDFSDEEPKT